MVVEWVEEWWGEAGEILYVTACTSKSRTISTCYSSSGFKWISSWVRQHTKKQGANNPTTWWLQPLHESTCFLNQGSREFELYIFYRRLCQNTYSFHGKGEWQLQPHISVESCKFVGVRLLWWRSTSELSRVAKKRDTATKICPTK